MVRDLFDRRRWSFKAQQQLTDFSRIACFVEELVASHEDITIAEPVRVFIDLGLAGIFFSLQIIYNVEVSILYVNSHFMHGCPKCLYLEHNTLSGFKQH
jgi:hypothetical protein